MSLCMLIWLKLYKNTLDYITIIMSNKLIKNTQQQPCHLRTYFLDTLQYRMVSDRKFHDQLKLLSGFCSRIHYFAMVLWTSSCTMTRLDDSYVHQLRSSDGRRLRGLRKFWDTSRNQEFMSSLPHLGFQNNHSRSLLEKFREARDEFVDNNQTAKE